MTEKKKNVVVRTITTALKIKRITRLYQAGAMSKEEYERRIDEIDRSLRKPKEKK